MSNTRNRKRKSSASRFEVADDLSDVCLIVEKKKIYVNRQLLMINSSVFRTMFTGNFKEKDLKEIHLPGKRYDTVIEMLNHIYPGIIDFKDETIENLLKLADEYDVCQVFENFKQHLYNIIDDELTTGQTLLYLGMAEKYPKLSCFRKRLINLASEITIQKLRKSKFFRLVPASAVRDALMHQILKFGQCIPININKAKRRRSEADQE